MRNHAHDILQIAAKRGRGLKTRGLGKNIGVALAIHYIGPVCRRLRKWGATVAVVISKFGLAKRANRAGYAGFQRVGDILNAFLKQQPEFLKAVQVVALGLPVLIFGLETVKKIDDFFRIAGRDCRPVLVLAHPVGKHRVALYATGKLLALRKLETVGDNAHWQAKASSRGECAVYRISRQV